MLSTSSQQLCFRRIGCFYPSLQARAQYNILRTIQKSEQGVGLNQIKTLQIGSTRFIYHRNHLAASRYHYGVNLGRFYSSRTACVRWNSNALLSSTLRWSTVHPLHSNLGSISCMSSWNQNNKKPPRFSNTSRVGIFSSLFGSALLLGGKTKYLLGALKLTKFASLGSMFVTVGTYSVFFGLPYAVGMVSLILIHESGHALAMKHFNIPFSPMIFVPFVGASVAMNRAPTDAYQEAMIALGGPVLGSLGAFACAGAAQVTQSQLLFALADFGFMINLFNMLPIGMMDGGRICGALSPYSGVAGLGMGGALIYMDMISNPIFYLVMMGGAYSTFQRFYNPGNAPHNYYKITPRQRTFLTASYFGLLGFLMGSMAFNQQFKKSPRQLEMEKTYQLRHQQW